MCKGAYTYYNIHDEIFAEFDFALQFRMAGANDCIVNTLPSISEQLTIFYFQETNQTVCVKYAIMSSKKISNDQELIQSDPTSCPQNQKGNN